MSNCVLFSPIGNTDPVRAMHDGPLLHILRRYKHKPEKVYLFFTKDILLKEEGKNKQAKVLAILEGIKTVDEFNGEITIIAPEDLLEENRHLWEKYDVKEMPYIVDTTDASNFDIFINLFDDLLVKIHEENEEAEILLNISSGTAQIISTLCLKAVTSPVKFIPIQVKTPNKSSNAGTEHGDDIEDNLDAFPGDNDGYEEEHRYVEPDILSFKKSMVKTSIISSINSYEYLAALNMVNENKELFKNNENLIKLIEYAKFKQNADKRANNNKYKNFKIQFETVQDYEAKQSCDFYCILQNKMKTGELSYFILLLKPLIEYLLQIFTKVKSINDLTENDKKSLEDYYKEYYYKTFDMTKKVKGKRLELNIRDYLCILKGRNQGEFRSRIDEINSLIENNNLRNELAHNIKRIDDADYIKDIEKALDNLKWIIIKIFGNKVTKNKNAFNFYDRVNDEIIKLLDN